MSSPLAVVVVFIRTVHLVKYSAQLTINCSIRIAFECGRIGIHVSHCRCRVHGQFKNNLFVYRFSRKMFLVETYEFVWRTLRHDGICDCKC